MQRLPVVSVALVALTACGVEDTSEVPQLLVPDDVEVHWDRSFNRVDDGVVALVPVDLMIYDRTTGLPLANVVIDVHALSPDAGLIEPDAVLRADPELDGEWLWDAWRDRWFEFIDPEIGPTASLRVRTDAWGLARVYVYADAFPAASAGDAGVFAPIPIVVSMGITDDTFLLVPR